jgi:phage repressor protein C with HTH and peptisase S24 domain
MNQTEMSYRMGITQTTYSKIELGKSSLTIEHLVRLASSLGVSSDWLINGIGEMYLKDAVNNRTIEEGNILVPVVAFAGYPQAWPDQIDNMEVVNIPGVTGKARTFEVDGDSMYPVLQPGDWVCGKLVDDPVEIKQNQVYVIVGKEEGITVKYIQVLSDRLRCVAENTAYQATEIPLENVMEIWQVVVRVTRHLDGGKTDPELIAKVGRIEAFLKENFNQFK